MEKIVMKKRMLDASIRRHQQVIDDFDTRLAELKTEDEAISEEGFQQPQRPYNEQVMPEENVINQQLQQANAEMELLNEIKNTGSDELHRRIGAGSVVKTDKGTFFVAAATGQFEVDGEEIIGISDNSPIFQAMKGKGRDDRFDYNEQHYTIQEVY